MELRTLLEENRETILEGWFDLIVGTYPRVASEFLAKQKDPFRNPVGQTLTESIGPIYDQIVSSMDTEELLRALDGIIRIRSVQEFSPSEAVAFILQLRAVIRHALEGRSLTAEMRDDLAEIDARIDQVALLAFEKYVECREQLHEVRNNEVKRRTTRLLERMNVKSPVSQRKGEAVDADS